ncbi:MAG: VIT and vWA domain-containing protein, partial [Methyloligellaceae bacterium]
MTVEKCLAAAGAICLLFAVTLSASRAGPEEAKTLGGQVQAEIGGKKIRFPVLKTDINADVQGDLATVTVVQTFANPTTTPLNAVYLFPLNKDAAVYAMQMEVGDERVVAQIKKKEEAKTTFEQAKSEGKAAALLTQHRPNMFTQNLANLMPGLPVKVTLKYVQTVPRIDKAYELVVPLIVGPRYQPAAAQAPPPPKSDAKFGQWELQTPPDYPDVAGLTIPDTIDRDRVSIEVNLRSGFALKDVTSATHAVTATCDGRSKAITLADGRAIGNRDFVLRYRLAGRTVEAGVLTHRDDRGGFFSLMIEPPKSPAAKEVTPRELVFVLDTSGSMYGEPVEASKTFMRHALKKLRPTDSFRIVRFSNNATEFSSGPVPATQQNISLGLSFVNRLSAGGGTEIPNAIRRAFDVPQTPGTLRIVVFLSDGYIGNEAEVLGLIASRIGKARIYAFGVGTGVNRYLLAEMARKGRG